MTDVLKHAFVSPRLDGSDPTQIQPSHWNAGHKFAGGAHGDVLIRDTGDPAFGARWGATGLANVVTTAATGTVDNLALGLASPVTILRCTNAAALTITGFAFTTAPRDGDRVLVQTRAAGAVYLVHASPSSTYRLANFATASPTPIAGASIGRADYVFEASSGYWILQAHEQGAPIAIPFVAGNYNGQGVLTAAMVPQHDYYLSGRTCLGTIVIEAFPATGGLTLNVHGWPFPPTGAIRFSSAAGTINGPWGAVNMIVQPGYVAFQRFDFGAIPAGSQYLYGQSTWTVA